MSNKEMAPTPEPTYEQQMMQVAQQFLQRTDLKGNEVDAYARLFNLIQSIVDGTSLIIPAEVWAEVTAKEPAKTPAKTPAKRKKKT